MNALVVYESMYGNTRAIAEAIADGLGGAEVVPVHEAADLTDVDLLVVGGPTHVHGLASPRSRTAAVQAAHEASAVDADASLDAGLREWLADLQTRGLVRAAAFDTRIDKRAWITGAASHGIARRLRAHGYDVIAAESFRVTESEGPLVQGELDRAWRWGRRLMASQRVGAGA